MAGPGSASEIRPVIAPMRWLLYAASSLVFLAGLQLSLLTEQTDTYFAWTIAPPLTAAFLGAAYWAAVPVELTAARETVWAKARVAVPAIWLFTTLTLVATLVHFDRFHFSSPIASAQGAAWFWLAIYAGVPVAMLLIGWLQIRAPGGDPPRGSPAPTWMRVLVLGQGGGMLVFGAGLFLLPSAVTSLALAPHDIDVAGHRSVADRHRVRGRPRDPRERPAPDHAPRRRVRGLRGPGAHRPRAVRRYRELGNAGGVGLPRIPPQRPPGRPCGAPYPTVARSVLNRPRRFIPRSAISATRDPEDTNAES